MAWAQRVALVTGAASGLGLATATRLARLGARVALVDLSDPSEAADGVREAAQEGGNGGDALSLALDVTDEAAVQSGLDSVQSKFGAPPSVVVNCAGIAPPAKVLGKKGPHSLAMFSNVLNVNVSGTFNVVRLTAARMAESDPYNGDGERGVIVNTASVAAYDGQMGQAAYAASKGAIVALTLPLARDLASHGIRVNTIAPGIMLTPMMAGLPQKAQDSLAQLVQFPKRLGDPDEYAQLVQQMVENRYMNGEVVRLDGSLRMPAK